MLSHSRCSLHVYLISKYRNFLDWEFGFLSSKLYLFYDLLIFLSNRLRWDKNYQKKILHKNVHLRFNNNMFQVNTTDVFSQNVGVQFLLHNVHLYKRLILYMYLCKYMHFRRVTFHFTLMLNKIDLKVKKVILCFYF